MTNTEIQELRKFAKQGLITWEELARLIVRSRESEKLEKMIEMLQKSE